VFFFSSIEIVGTDKSFDGKVRNFLAEINSPNCLGKMKEFSVENNKSDCSDTFETYSIESDFDTWDKVSECELCIFLIDQLINFV